MLKSFIKYSRHAENFSPRYFLTKKEYVPFVTETRKLNPVLHRKNSIKYLSSSSDKDKGKVKENGGIEFDIGNRRKINVVLYKGDIKIDIRQYYKDDHGEDKVSLFQMTAVL
jgi:hypothetical protein